MSPSERYSRTAIVLHWLIALAVIAQFVWGWRMQAIPKSPPGVRALAFNIHKSVGITIFFLMCLRAGWRWRHPPPPLPAMPRWQATLARTSHLTFYIVLLAMPVVGYLGSSFSGYPIEYFGVPLPAWASRDASLKALMSSIHLGLSWALAVVLALHIAGALKHWLWDGDGVAGRMGLPAPRRHGAKDP